MVRPYRAAEYQTVDWERSAPPLAVRQRPQSLRSAAPAPPHPKPKAATTPAATATASASVTAGLIKVTVYSAIIATTATSLTRLLPLHTLQQERLSLLAAEVERLDQRVAQVQVAIPGELNLDYLDLSQASAAMRERVNYIPPNQLHVRLDVPETEWAPPELNAPKPQLANLLGFFWPWR